MSKELESCPLCGALPIDQVDSHAVEQHVRNRYKFSRQGLLDGCAPMTAPTPAGEEMGGPICPFCGRDPFVYVDNGVGMEAVAVHCCGLGDIYFRGARPASEEVTLSWEEFREIGQRLSSPLVERARALEEAAKVADEMAVNRDRVSGVAAHACRVIASRIRSLPPKVRTP